MSTRAGGGDRWPRRWSNLASLWKRPQPVVGATPHDVVHAEGKWRLLRYRPPTTASGAAVAQATRSPLLLVPSLINRHYVLDLQPGKSFAEWLVAHGHDVFVIDWGTPGDEDRYVTFDDVADRALGRAIRRACAVAGSERAHLLGYCLGGTLVVAHAAVRPERVASIVALAAPIGFADDGLLSAWTRSPTFDVGAMVDALGNAPTWLMQPAFHLLRPTLSLSKGVHLLDRAWDDAYLDGFLALERWGNDNVAFPGEAYRTYVEQLYRGDGLLRGTFSLGGRPVRLEQITCPTLAVTFEHDNIVPWRSAAVLLDRISSAEREHIHMPGGHVGAVVSRKASETLWPQLSAWWAAHDQPVSPPARAATTT
ncbi:MAG: alpha/beta fold hydrolase, partial [Deltaproteobacteria bacterium]|nr:alpha/beta fold hydrolase [Deltaproteobacteria bacterium]